MDNFNNKIDLIKKSIISVIIKSRYILLFLFLIMICIFSYNRYCLGLPWADWTGFQGKTLWDFQIIFLGAATAIIIAFLNDINISKRKKLEIEISIDKYMDNIVLSYLNKIEIFIRENKDLIKHNFDEIDETIKIYLQLQTKLTLGMLDTKRKEKIIQIIRDSGLYKNLLTNCNFEDYDLSELNLSQFNFKNANLRNSNFSKAILHGTNFENAVLEKSNFECANAWGADFSKANLRESNLRKTNLRSAFLNDADLQGADFYGAILDDASVHNSLMLHAKNLTVKQFTHVKGFPRSNPDFLQ